MLLSLPNELVLNIADELSDTTDILALSRTSKRLSQLLQSTLDKESQRLQDAAKAANLSLIHFSALKDNIPGTQLALKLNPNCIDEFSNDYGTALHIAIKYGFLKLLQVLLNNGADPNCKMKMVYLYVTPLHYMLCSIHQKILRSEEYQKREIPIVKQLLQRGANPITSDVLHGNAFHHIVVGRVPELVTAILSTGLVDINGRDSEGLTVLHNAIRFWGLASLPTVEKLLELGIDLDATDYLKRSAIFYTCLLNDGESLTALLMKFGCNPNIQRFDGKTIFHCIARKEDYGVAVKVMKQVLSSKKTCLIDLKDCAGKTALDYSKRILNWELVDLLIAYESTVFGLAI